MLQLEARLVVQGASVQEKDHTAHTAFVLVTPDEPFTVHWTAPTTTQWVAILSVAGTSTAQLVPPLHSFTSHALSARFPKEEQLNLQTALDNKIILILYRCDLTPQGHVQNLYDTLARFEWVPCTTGMMNDLGLGVEWTRAEIMSREELERKMNEGLREILTPEQHLAYLDLLYHILLTSASPSTTTLSPAMQNTMNRLDQLRHKLQEDLKATRDAELLLDVGNIHPPHSPSISAYRQDEEMPERVMTRATSRLIAQRGQTGKRKENKRPRRLEDQGDEEHCVEGDLTGETPPRTAGASVGGAGGKKVMLAKMVETDSTSEASSTTMLTSAIDSSPLFVISSPGYVLSPPTLSYDLSPELPLQFSSINDVGEGVHGGATIPSPTITRRGASKGRSPLRHSTINPISSSPPVPPLPPSSTVTALDSAGSSSLEIEEHGQRRDSGSFELPGSQLFLEDVEGEKLGGEMVEKVNIDEMV